MERIIGVTEAQTKLAEVVEQVREQGDTVMLVNQGQPAAVIVPVELFERWKSDRQVVGDLIRALQAGADPMEEEAALALAREAQQAARKDQARK